MKESQVLYKVKNNVEVRRSSRMTNKSNKSGQRGESYKIKLD